MYLSHQLRNNAEVMMGLPRMPLKSPLQPPLRDDSVVQQGHLPEIVLSGISDLHFSPNV